MVLYLIINFIIILSHYFLFIFNFNFFQFNLFKVINFIIFIVQIMQFIFNLLNHFLYYLNFLIQFFIIIT